jgi:hypothetical protein
MSDGSRSAQTNSEIFLKIVAKALMRNSHLLLSEKARGPSLGFHGLRYFVCERSLGRQDFSCLFNIARFWHC